MQWHATMGQAAKLSSTVYTSLSYKLQTESTKSAMSQSNIAL